MGVCFMILIKVHANCFQVCYKTMATSVSPWENQVMKAKIIHVAVQSNNVFLQASASRSFAFLETGFLFILFCKSSKDTLIFILRISSLNFFVQYPFI